MGRRPILMTASDPSVVNTIPIPFRVCNLQPLKLTAVEAFLRQISNREKCVINSVLPDIGNPGAFLEKSSSQTLDARLLAATDYFHDIRRALNEAHFYGQSSASSSPNNYSQTSKKITNIRDRDLLDSFIERFPCLLSLTVPSARSLLPESSVTMKASSQVDVFDGIFDSDTDYAEPSNRPSTEGKTNRSPEKPVEQDLPVDFVYLPAKQCRRLASDCLTCLASACDMQSLIDVLHASAMRRQYSAAGQIADEFFERSEVLSREAQASGLSATASTPVLTLSTGTPTTTSTSFATHLSCLGDACDTLTGVDPLGRRSAFRGEGTWRGLISLVFGNKMEYLNSVQLPVHPPSSPVANLAGYCRAGCVQPDLTHAKITASQSLSFMDSMRQNPNVMLALGLREASEDYLSSLRTIARLEGARRSFSAQRRFFHYFDKIGLPEEMRANLPG
uniref:ATPase family AAA domain-containing protein 5 n=1 Tax=Schistocephalus solidus TaxID=70667 RepID=A0A0X3Q6Y1_SCHSO